MRVVPTRYEVVPTDFGFVAGSGRDMARTDEGVFWTANVMLMPFHKIIASNPMAAHVWAPIDDENTMLYSVDFNAERPLTDADLARSKAHNGIHTENIPGTDRAIQNKDNDYLIDRELQAQRRLVHRHEGARHPGLRDPGIDGADRRPHAGASRHQRHRDREDPPPAVADAQGPRRRQAAARRRSQELARALGALQGARRRVVRRDDGSSMCG